MRLYLEANAARAGVRTVVLSDADGLLVGGIGDVDLEVLAAIGPLFVTGNSASLAQHENLINSVVQNHDLYASRIEIAGQTFVLTSLGARLPEQRRAEQAFNRIFNSAS
ncbi:MAG: hypothetical protein IPK82_15375 [Polyangiaceae bacterium]|nr:hypothetical protein [Polyangiaceae bacterium]